MHLFIYKSTSGRLPELLGMKGNELPGYIPEEECIPSFSEDESSFLLFLLDKKGSRVYTASVVTQTRIHEKRRRIRRRRRKEKGKKRGNDMKTIKFITSPEKGNKGLRILYDLCSLILTEDIHNCRL